jgi:hypothetical protein
LLAVLCEAYVAEKQESLTYVWNAGTIKNQKGNILMFPNIPFPRWTVI